MDFVALFMTLATRQSAGRMRIWRALRAAGAVTLRDGVYILPADVDQAAALEPIADEARKVGGNAELFLIRGRDAAASRRLAGLFDRSPLYAELLASIRRSDPGDARARRGFRRAYLALSAIDFFPGEARRQTEEALAALDAVADGEPKDASGTIRRLAIADYQGRLWATRRHLWVDRMASAWLIRRFIDPEARFLWLADPKRCPKKALGFDFDGAAFTHTGGLVSFEVLAASFGLSADPVLSHIAAVVHFLDAGGVPVPEAAGIEAVLAGARDAATDDNALVDEACRVFDHLYRHHKRANAHD